MCLVIFFSLTLKLSLLFFPLYFLLLFTPSLFLFFFIAASRISYKRTDTFLSKNRTRLKANSMKKKPEKRLGLIRSLLSRRPPPPARPLFPPQSTLSHTVHPFGNDDLFSLSAITCRPYRKSIKSLNGSHSAAKRERAKK